MSLVSDFSHPTCRPGFEQRHGQERTLHFPLRPYVLHPGSSDANWRIWGGIPPIEEPQLGKDGHANARGAGFASDSLIIPS